jgi:hypothetical protein
MGPPIFHLPRFLRCGTLGAIELWARRETLISRWVPPHPSQVSTIYDNGVCVMDNLIGFPSERSYLGMEKSQFARSQERQSNSLPSIWVTQIRGSPSKWVFIQVLILVRRRKVQLDILCVVMGPSGAGKTSFLDVVSQSVLSSDSGALVSSFRPHSVVGVFEDDAV